jgi:hypothetical protein
METAGRAVECIFRAYFFRKNGPDAVLKAAHNIPELFKASGFKTIALEARQKRGDSEAALSQYSRELEADIIDINSRWGNDFRYASEDRLRAHLKDLKLDRRMKGEVLKRQAKILIEAVRRIVDEGGKRWSHSKKK